MLDGVQLTGTATNAHDKAKHNQSSIVYVYDWTNEVGFHHRAVTTYFYILLTGILSVLSRKFGIGFINNFLHQSANILILYVVNVCEQKPRNNKKLVINITNYNSLN